MSSRAMLAQIQTISNDMEKIVLTVQERLKDHSHVLREPNPLRRSQLRDAIIQGRSDVQNELDGVKLLGTKLSDLQTLLDQQSASYISRISPIHALPPEILARIFDWTKGRDGYVSRSYRTTLMLVSKSWSQFIEHHPSLWTFQPVSTQNNSTLDLGIVRQRFTRSGVLPLQLQIHFQSHHPSIVLPGSDPDLDASWLIRLNKLQIIGHRGVCLSIMNGFRSLVPLGQLPSPSGMGSSYGRFISSLPIMQAIWSRTAFNLK